MLLDICIEPRPTGPGVLSFFNLSRITRTFILLCVEVISLDAACDEDSRRSPLRDPYDE